MNVAVIAPHPDDEAIGCGGTIALHVSKGDRVTVVFLSSGELGLKSLPAEEAKVVREQESQCACEVLGVSQAFYLRQPDWMLSDEVEAAAIELAPLLTADSAEVIYLPHSEDEHPDHAACTPILRRALQMGEYRPERVRGFEVWTPIVRWDSFHDITPVMKEKLRAIECYQSQITQFAYARGVIGLNQYRGALVAKTDYAEVFATIEF